MAKWTKKNQNEHDAMQKEIDRLTNLSLAYRAAKAAGKAPETFQKEFRAQLEKERASVTAQINLLQDYRARTENEVSTSECVHSRAAYHGSFGVERTLRNGYTIYVRVYVDSGDCVTQKDNLVFRVQIGCTWDKAGKKMLPQIEVDDPKNLLDKSGTRQKLFTPAAFRKAVAKAEDGAKQLGLL